MDRRVQSHVEYANPDGACPAQGLYSHVAEVRSSRLLYVAGQLSVGADGGIVGAGDFRRSFARSSKISVMFSNGCGCGFDDVVKFTTYLVHAQDIPIFMELRAELFPKLFKGPLFPPNTLLVVDRLVKEPFLFEVEAVVAPRESD